jgi:hypothetical protein
MPLIWCAEQPVASCSFWGFLADLVSIERAPRARVAGRRSGGDFMLDVMMVAIALGFFVVALGYVIACDRM